MTKEEIDILWNKAIRESVDDGSLYTRYRFADLVVAHVRETEFKPDWNNYRQGLADGAASERNSWPAEMEAMERQVNILTDALAQAVAAEREECAKVCEEYESDMGYGQPQKCADAIRARSNT